MSGGTRSDRQTLSGRHVQFIAIGGAIGAGLFVGSGRAIAIAGPAVLLAYLIAAIPAFVVARCIGEFVLAESPGASFLDMLAGRLGAPVATAFGWAYWMLWLLAGMFELSAASTLIAFWFPAIPAWVSILVGLAALTAINFGHIRLFGEFEFWLSLIKVLTILGVIGFGLVWIGHAWMIAGAVPAQAPSASALRLAGGFIPHGWRSVFATLPSAMFAFGGVELIGLTAARVEDPERMVPRAVNSLIFRIALFYLGSLGVIVAIVPWQAFTPAKSPYVEVFRALGLDNAAALVNVVVLSAVLSACNSGLFATGQMLAGLAERGVAPRWLRHRPGEAYRKQVGLSALLMLGSVIASYFVPSEVLTTLATMIAVFVAGTWIIILVGYLAIHLRRSAAAAAPRFAVPSPWLTIPAALAVVLSAGGGLVFQNHGYAAVAFGLSVYGGALACHALTHRHRLPS